MKRQKLAAGIDIGGTNIVYGLVDASGNIMEKGSVPTQTFPEIHLLVDEISRRLQAVFQSHPEVDIIGCGIGAPNGNYYTGCIEHAPNLAWKGIVPIAALFEKQLQVKTIVTNDANAAAIGEMIYGAAKSMKDFIIITLGTGVGSGIVVNGQLVYGHDGFAGEIGHVIVERNGRACGCGRKGCLETYCSATGIVTTYKQFSGSSSEAINAKFIYDRALSGEAAAVHAFEYTGEILGLALANSVAYTSPQAFFLFGGLARAGDLILKPTRKSFEDNLLNIYQKKATIQLSQLNENDGAILGAASLIWQQQV